MRFVLVCFLAIALNGCSSDPPQQAATDIQHAAASGDLDAVKSLLSKNPELATQRDSFGLTPLHAAASGGHKDVVLLLLENKADPNAQAYAGVTPLISAINADKPEVVAVLLEHGANANARGPDGRAAIDIAQQKGQTSIVEMLRKKMQ